MKTCTLCKIEKNLSEFSVLSRSPDGRYPQCRVCKSKIDKEYYEKKREFRKQKASEYYDSNKDKILEKRKQNESYKEYNKRYKEENKDLLREYQKNWLKINKEARKIKKAEYRKLNKEKINEYNKKRRVTNPITALSVKKQARKSLSIRK